MSVLDLASGAGNPAISLARQAGPDGRVLATDLASGTLLGTLRCAVESGLRNLYCCAADMQQLPFPAGCFDRVVCRFGIMYSPELAQALAEIKRVLKSGGQAAFLVWGALAENTAFDVLHRTVSGFLGRENAGEALQPFRFGAPGSLSIHLQRAGFERVTEQAIHFSTTTPPGKRFWDVQLEVNYGAAVIDLPTSLRAALDEQIEAAFEPYRSGAGYRLAGHVRLVTGQPT
jgi:ubiquinone/menaquinone biosynthesis C-methylase UbiE